MENDVFYNYYLEREIERRKEALKLYDECDYNKLLNNYIHYFKRTYKEVELKDLSIDGVIEELTKIKATLPKNSYDAKITIRVEGGNSLYSSEEKIAFVTWCEYTIEDEEKCSSLAKHYAKISDWEMKYQPNGEKGKAALALYEKLTKI